VIEMTLNGSVEGKATGQVVAAAAVAVAALPIVLISSAIDLQQTLGFPTEETTEEMIAVTADETTWIPTFLLQVLEPTEIEADPPAATAGGLVARSAEVEMIPTYHLPDGSLHVETTVQDHL
jgi:hypothetical protein